MPLPKESEEFDVEDRRKMPREVTVINKWLGVNKRSNILKRIKQINNLVKNTNSNKNLISGKLSK